MQEVVMVQDGLDKGSCDEFRNCSTYGWCFKIILPRHKQKAGHPNDISNESDCTTLSQLPFTRIGGPLTFEVLYAAWPWSAFTLLLIFRPLIAADHPPLVAADQMTGLIYSEGVGRTTAVFYTLQCTTVQADRDSHFVCCPSLIGHRRPLASRDIHPCMHVPLGIQHQDFSPSSRQEPLLLLSSEEPVIRKGILVGCESSRQLSPVRKPCFSAFDR